MPAPQTYNAQNGSDARYDIRGLRKEGNVYVDDAGYKYDANGLSLNRPNSYVQGLPGAKEMNGRNAWDNSGGGGGGGGGGFSGSPIPNAGAYGEQMAIAQAAYNAAVAAAKAKKSQSFRMGGLDEATGMVDPLAQHGEYQQLLQGQGGELDQLLESSQERGLFGRGLGNQGERLARYGHAVQNLGFQGRVQGWSQDYNAAMTQAEIEKRDRMVAALQSARDNAYGDWGGGGSDADGDGDPSTHLWAPDERFAPQYQKLNTWLNNKKPIQQPALTRQQAASAAKAQPLAKYGWGAAATVAKKAAPPKYPTLAQRTGNPLLRGR